MKVRSFKRALKTVLGTVFVFKKSPRITVKQKVLNGRTRARRYFTILGRNRENWGPERKISLLSWSVGIQKEGRESYNTTRNEIGGNFSFRERKWAKMGSSRTFSASEAKNGHKSRKNGWHYEERLIFG